MSNTIFFFIFGLTVGILLSISLVSHYGRGHVPPKYNSEGLKVTESLTNVKEQNSNVDAPNVISASSPTVTSNPSSSESFWIPGREGSFLKFKNNNSAMNAESGSSRRDSNQGGNRKSSIRGKGGNYMGEVLKDQMKADIAKAIIPISSITKPQSAKVIEYKGGDNVEIQSKFYSDSGERIDLLSLAAKDPSLAGVRVHDHPPLVPYHSQAYQKNPLDPPYIPSLESVNKQRAAKLRRDPASSSKFSSLSSTNGSEKALPNMEQQEGVFEPDNLKLHLCNGVFEAYSGAYLTTSAHMLKVMPYNLSWVNCEMASFLHMKENHRFFKDPHGEGMVIQSLDVLDFSVVHLSAYERSSRKHRKSIWTSKADLKNEWSKIEAVKAAAAQLALRNNPLLSGMNITWSAEAHKTVVLMPFLGGAMGAGHSELGNRFDYLKACFWSIYEFLPNIVAGVTRKEDVDWCRNQSGLPFYDVLLMDALPKGAALPVGTTQLAKEKLKSGEWPFEYVFFTESDQILISRTLPMMFDHLKKYPGRMILPHRLMPYSKEVMTISHKRTVDTIETNKWMQQSCCLERQNCVNRKNWKELAHPDVPVIDFYGLYVPLGNVNFLLESFRPCTLSPYIGDYCP